MKKALTRWQIAGFIFTAIFGTLLHFAYDLSGQSPFLAPFSAVNESTWEHMKILFFPMFVFALVESVFIGKEHQNFWCAKLFGILLGLILIPVLFYTYKGILGFTVDWINIAIFFISAAAAYIFETRFLNRKTTACNSTAAFAAICFILLLFVVFTYVQPKIGLFIDPVSLSYGI